MDKQRVREYLFCAFCTVLMVFTIMNLQVIFRWLQWLLEIAAPIFIGGALAFVLSRPYNRLHKAFRRRLPKAKPEIPKACAAAAVYALFLGGIVLLFSFVIPQIGQSIDLLIKNMNSYYANLQGVANTVSTWLPFDLWTELKIDERIQKLIKEIPTIAGQIAPGLYAFTSKVIGGITNVVLGFVLSVYLLVDKEKLGVQFKKFMRTFFPRSFCNKTFALLELCSRTFSNFISGQLTDALILGVMCFIGMNLLGFEYSLLISVIVAVTNMIPIVGPIIGAVPSTFILLLANPAHALWFVVFIIVLQQIEANLIYPKIVGDSVGLPSMWVLVAVIIGGGVFGIWGMVLGIPVVSVIYELLSRRMKNQQVLGE